MANREFLNLTQASANKVRIEIDGTIGGFDWDTWTYKNTGTDIRKQLKSIAELDVDEIEVLITSLGGYVDEAFQIHDALKEHKAKVTTLVQGFCASAATIIACAGDVRIISPNALYLIHKCRGDIYEANENALEEALESQRTINDVMLNIYKGVLKKDEADLLSLFEANHGEGKWITAEEAMAFGFATEIQDFDTETKKPATAMARFLNQARAAFPDNNRINIINQNPPVMKKIMMSFAMLSALLAFREEDTYDEKEGLTLSPEDLQKIEDSLKDYSILKENASKNETELTDVKSQLETAQSDITAKDDLIATLTAERDSYKAKYEAMPAHVQPVNGPDAKEEDGFEACVKNNPVYEQIFKENL